ncbi:Nn.00g108720.m01.CDS01 [Neocucurbitaria sp. VM-36]
MLDAGRALADRLAKAVSGATVAVNTSMIWRLQRHLVVFKCRSVELNVELSLVFEICLFLCVCFDNHLIPKCFIELDRICIESLSPTSSSSFQSSSTSVSLSTSASSSSPSASPSPSPSSSSSSSPSPTPTPTPSPVICNVKGLPGANAFNHSANFKTDQASYIATCKTDSGCFSTGFYLVADPTTGSTTGTCCYYDKSVAQSANQGVGYYTFNDKAYQVQNASSLQTLDHMINKIWFTAII